MLKIEEKLIMLTIAEAIAIKHILQGNDLSVTQAEYGEVIVTKFIDFVEKMQNKLERNPSGSSLLTIYR